jgi:hypothetical protein
MKPSNRPPDTLRPHIWQQRFFWSESRYVGMIAGIRGGKTVIGSLAFLKDLTACPPGSIGLITGPSLPDIKRTSLETLLNGVGPHRHGSTRDTRDRPLDEVRVGNRRVMPAQPDVGRQAFDCSTSASKSRRSTRMRRRSRPLPSGSRTALRVPAASMSLTAQ